MNEKRKISPMFRDDIILYLFGTSLKEGDERLFKNEIEDIYPNCEYQVPNKIQNQFIDSKNGYKKVTLLPSARMSFFALIPDSAHFNVIENPKGCASAVNDFISECNLEKI